MCCGIDPCSCEGMALMQFQAQSPRFTSRSCCEVPFSPLTFNSFAVPTFIPAPTFSSLLRTGFNPLLFL